MIAVAGVLAAAPFYGQTARSETITQAVQDGLSFDPAVRRDQALRMAAEETVDENFADFLPRFDFEFNSGYEYTDSPATRGGNSDGSNFFRNEAIFSLSQLLFDFNSTANRVASARFELEASNADLQATSEQVGLDTVQVYLDRLEDLELVRIGEANVADHMELVDRIRGRVGAGRSSEADLDTGLSRLALARADLVALQGFERRSLSRYIETVGHPPDRLVRPAEPSYPESKNLDAAIATAMKLNPVVNSTAAVWDARQADVEVNRATYWPRFDITAFSRFGDKIDGVRGTRNEFNVLLQMRWNLFDGFGKDARVRESTFEALAASNTDADARRAVREQVRVAFRALGTARDRLPPLRDDVVASRQVFEAYQVQWDLGQRSLLDLLESRADLFDSEIELVRGEYAILRAHYDLLFATGQLLEALGITIFPDPESFEQTVSLPEEEGESSATSIAAVPGPAEVGGEAGDERSVSTEGGIRLGALDPATETAIAEPEAAEPSVAAEAGAVARDEEEAAAETAIAEPELAEPASAAEAETGDSDLDPASALAIAERDSEGIEFDPAAEKAGIEPRALKRFPASKAALEEPDAGEGEREQLAALPQPRPSGLVPVDPDSIVVTDYLAAGIEDFVPLAGGREHTADSDGDAARADEDLPPAEASQSSLEATSGEALQNASVEGDLEDLFDSVIESLESVSLESRDEDDFSYNSRP